MKRIVVLGAGESGAGAAVLAKVKGFDTFVSDMSNISEKYKNLLKKHDISWEEGKHTEELILNADEIIKSPGIPNEAPIIQKLKAQDGYHCQHQHPGCPVLFHEKHHFTQRVFCNIKNSGINTGLLHIRKEIRVYSRFSTCFKICKSVHMHRNARDGRLSSFIIRLFSKEPD